MNITELTVHELKEKLANKEITISEITKAYVDRIQVTSVFNFIDFSFLLFPPFC